jgi:hypothetical protein
MKSEQNIILQQHCNMMSLLLQQPTSQPTAEQQELINATNNHYTSINKGAVSTILPLPSYLSTI